VADASKNGERTEESHAPAVAESFTEIRGTDPC